MTRCRSGGFTLIEVLVALVIALVGMMGAAGLIVRTVQQEVDAFQRLQALNLVQDITDRINANRQVVDCYSDAANGRVLGTGATAPTACTLGTAEQRATANLDLAEWNAALLGAARQNEDDENIGAMVGARGCIEQIDAVDRRYRVTVVWQGMSESTAPAANLLCGQNQYGDDDRQRRVVSAVVQIGDLS